MTRGANRQAAAERKSAPVKQAASSARKARRRLMTLSVGALLLLGALIGYSLTRPKPWHRSGPPISVSGWAPYWQTDSALASFSDNRAVFSNISLFAYQATAADAISAFDGLGADVPGAYHTAARAAGVALTASIIDGTAANVMAGILADPTSRQLHVDTIVAFARNGDFDGIDLDYENFAFNDGRDTWEVTRPNWVAFVTELASALHGDGKTLTVSVPSSGDYPVYDYEAMGKVVDTIRIMAYDYSTSEAGPIAPIDWVGDVVSSAKKLVPARKLVLGVPAYGYDWPISIIGTCPGGEDDQPSKRNVSTKSAAALAAEKGTVPTWSASNAEVSFVYSDQLTGVDPAGAAVSCTVRHVVWYADARAVHARAYLAERQGLAGIAIWSLGSDDALVWEGIAAARADAEVWPPVDPTVTGG
jgi:spore germination protein YaaH